MNDLKIKTEDEKIKVLIDDKEIKYITKLSLNLEAGSMRTLKLECIVNNIDVETETKSEITSPQEILKNTLKEEIKKIEPIPVIETKNKKITI